VGKKESSRLRGQGYDKEGSIKLTTPEYGLWAGWGGGRGVGKGLKMGDSVGVQFNVSASSTHFPPS